jgi:hypothetical protein
LDGCCHIYVGGLGRTVEEIEMSISKKNVPKRTLWMDAKLCEVEDHPNEHVLKYELYFDFLHQ